MKFTILIFGARGFIGSNLCTHFINAGCSVFGTDVFENSPNLKYQYLKVSRLNAQWEDIFKTTNFDVCINAAGSGNVANSIEHPAIDFEANTLDVLRILDALRKYQPFCKYLHISSAAVYGNPAQLPVNESASLNPISPYGYHKLMSEILCKEYHHLFEIPITIIRPFSIFGNGLRKQLLWDICTNLKQNDSITLFGTGRETRDFIHISDFTSFIEIILEKSNFDAEIFNAATGSQTSIREIAEIVERSYGNTKKISFNSKSKKGDPQHWEADITAVRKLGFEPQALLETSISEYVNWFNQEHEG